MCDLDVALSDEVCYSITSAMFGACGRGGVFLMCLYVVEGDFVVVEDDVFVQ